MILEITIILLSILVLGAKVYVQDWMSVLAFLFVLILCHYVFKTDNYISLGLAGIIACFVTLVGKKVSESFENKTENAEENGNLDEEDEDLGEEDVVEEEDVAEEEGEEDVVEEEEGEEEDEDSTKIDMKSTIQNALQNFDPKTLENMTNDTKKLIKSQSELMSTIEKMEPVISKGMSLLDQFQGNGQTEKLFKNFDKLRKMKKHTDKITK